MRTRRLGRTGLEVSELTLGTAQLRDGHILGAALDRGVNAIELKVGGTAESLFSQFAAQDSRARSMHIFSRVRPLVPLDLPVPHLHADAVYPGHEIRRQTEASLKKLGVDLLACQFLHAWCPEWLDEGDWLETLVRLREEGKIAAVGVSLFDHDLDSGLAAVASGVIDCTQLMSNLFDQGAASTLLPLCAASDVGVLARSPLYFGALSPAIHESEPFRAGDWRRDYFFEQHLEETRARVGVLEQEAEAQNRPLPDLALRFALSPPEVSSIVVGVSNWEQLEQDIDAVERGPLAAADLDRLRRHRWLC